MASELANMLYAGDFLSDDPAFKPCYVSSEEYIEDRWPLQTEVVSFETGGERVDGARGRF